MGGFWDRTWAFLVGIMSSIFLKVFNLKIKMEVSIMISSVLEICIAAGTALLGRSGDMFPILWEKTGSVLIAAR
jgi:hypothetical protein